MYVYEQLRHIPGSYEPNGSYPLHRATEFENIQLKKSSAGMATVLDAINLKHTFRWKNNVYSLAKQGFGDHLGTLPKISVLLLGRNVS